ncbi:Cyanovirin-N [Cordyceps fumosorosea ARSEF 2679]|uniref:Cyanovirin-N n=1 Tax=Cordyceps fumosorosea (strain ARSEF 2679) TaxID=1081104 RepID=A0A167MRR3_CORFA|nr:Cyanovirin-N [Cordyceps fumosorosea ARSEF 2679]OAA54682.1 Cyanovirin-N [Cordyceps fumosorosea ARSEF 2679]
MRWTRNTVAAALALATLGSCVHYTDSCADTNLSGTTLSGHCGDNKGNNPYSSLDLSKKVGNNWGVLTWGGVSFQNSCSEIVYNSWNGVLSAKCGNGGGRDVRTVLNLNNYISNNWGVLTFDS